MIANLASAPTQLAGQVQAALLANPNINYIFAPPGDLLPYISQAIRQAHDTGKVHIVFGSCQATAMPDLIHGGDTRACIGGSGSPQEGWISVDAAVRAYVKSPVPSTEYVPCRLFTQKTYDASLFNSVIGYLGSKGYQQEYLKLWGAKS